VPAEVEAMISDPPAEVAVEQVDTLLGYYCRQRTRAPCPRHGRFGVAAGSTASCAQRVFV
jgi:hypothetical protein